MNIELISKLNDVLRDYPQSGSRNEFLVLVLSRAVAFNLQLPTSAVENIYDFYISAHLSDVNRLISELNESIVIPVDVVKRAIRELWVARYRMVFCPTHDQVRSIMSAVLGCETSVYGEATLRYLAAPGTSVRVEQGADELRCILTTYLGLKPIQTEDDRVTVHADTAVPAITA